jgi:hypothetical protein
LIIASCSLTSAVFSGRDKKVSPMMEVMAVSLGLTLALTGFHLLHHNRINKQNRAAKKRELSTQPSTSVK